MGYQVNFNGVDIDQYMGILKVHRTVLPERKNFSKDIPSMFGEYYTGYKYSPKQLVLDCFITATSAEEHMDAINTISDVLNVSQPQQLIISDEPEKYMWAIPDGAISVEKVGNHGQFSITFICHDPYLYSVEEYVYEGDDSKKLTVENAGTVETYPRIGASFNSDSYFFQATNYDGQTILLGNRPDSEVPMRLLPFMFKEDCSTTTNWLPTGNVLDPNREIMGNITVNGGGYAIIPNDFGSSDKAWHGPAVRRSIGKDLTDFEIRVRVEHSSKGDMKQIGSTKLPPSPAPRNYYAASDVKLRQSRSASSIQLTVIPKGKLVSVSNVDKNFGQVTYNGKTGYVGMGFMSIQKPPLPIKSTGNYMTNSSTSMRSDRGTKYKTLKTIPKNTSLSVSDIKSGWGKVYYGGKSGYVYMTYLRKAKVTSYDAEVFSVPMPPSVENQRGLLEIYGFDKNGAKLFKFVARDSEFFYEYSQPEVYFGNILVLDDKRKSPIPKVGYVKDPSNGKFVKQSLDSGKYGDWNDMYAEFKIRRTTDSKGKQIWFAQVDKIVDGKVAKHIYTNNLSSTSYPTGQLNNVVAYFSQFKGDPACSVMSVTDVEVIEWTGLTFNDIKPIFHQGDELLIDSETQTITLNGQPFMEELDIGSQFFSIPTGESEFICVTDDDTCDVHATMNDRWI